MKQSGLKNRFREKTRNKWLDWQCCMVCGLNQPDSLHHMISPSCRHYVDGKHNESVLNSCPIHNRLHPSAFYHKGATGYGLSKQCHLDNEPYLFEDENLSRLLNKVRHAITIDLQIELEPIDIKFIEVYHHLYNYPFESAIIKEGNGISLSLLSS